LVVGFLLTIAISTFIFIHEADEKEDILNQIYQTDIRGKIDYIRTLISARMIARDIPGLRKDFEFISESGLLSGLSVYGGGGDLWLSMGKPVPLSLGFDSEPCRTCHAPLKVENPFLPFPIPLKTVETVSTVTSVTLQ